MPDRRMVLQLGAAASAAPVLGAAAGIMPAAADTTQPLTLYKAVFDERFADGRAFAGEFDRRGVTTAAIRGDVTRLWYDDLHQRWKAQPVAIAGLTERAALFCLEELARDVGMRVLFRADHLVDEAGEAAHSAIAPAPLAQATQELAPSRAFGQVMAALTSRCSAGHAAPAAAQMCSGPFSPTGRTALVSWVIAPRALV